MQTAAEANLQIFFHVRSVFGDLCGVKAIPPPPSSKFGAGGRTHFRKASAKRNRYVFPASFSQSTFKG
jgi:hypothetical protein